MQVEENLFGVEPGEIKTLAVRWAMEPNTDSAWVVTIDLGWANRKPSYVYVWGREDQSIGHVMGLFNNLTINGWWWGKTARWHVAKILATLRSEGFTVNVQGTAIAGK